MDDNHQYANREYWEERFKTEEEFEWLADFNAFKHLILPNLRTDSRYPAMSLHAPYTIIENAFRILHIGCGSSQMSMQLFDLGYRNITNVDYSQVLIGTKQRLYPQMKWICDDIRFLESIPSNSFDVVLEKATLEALLVKEKSPWSPSDAALETVESVMKSIARVLTDDGIFISISFTQPHFRVPALLRIPCWSVEVHEFGEHFRYFVYVMKCGKETAKDVKERYAHIAPEWSRPFTHS